MSASGLDQRRERLAIDGRMSRETVAVVGAEQLLLSKAVWRVASALCERRPGPTESCDLVESLGLTPVDI